MSNLSAKIDFYSFYYNDLTHLRALISSIPCIGSQLDLYFSTPGQKFVQNRLEFLLKTLQEEMADVQEYLINKEVFNTEDNFDLVQKTFLAASKTRQKDKLILFAKILKGSYIKREKTHDAELYLKIVEELTVDELQVVMLLYEVKVIKKINLAIDEDEAKNGMSNDPYLFSKHYQQYTQDELEFIFTRLEKTGLIKELVGSYIGYGGGIYNPTSLLDNFIDFIEIRMENE